MSDDRDALTHYLRYLDRLEAMVEHREQPAYAETCKCGATVTVAKGVSRPDLRSIHANFLGRHRACVGLPPRDPEASA